MAAVTLSKNHATTIRVGGHMFDLWEGDDGGLYIEADGRGGLTVAISDDDEGEVTVSGQWVTIQPEEVE